MKQNHIRVISASIKAVALFGAFYDYLSPALGARDIYLFYNRLCVFTFRIVWASQKLAEPPCFIYHVGPAFFTHPIGDLIGYLDMLYVFVGNFQLFFNGRKNPL
jgi:hypothetical protein